MREFIITELQLKFVLDALNKTGHEISMLPYRILTEQLRLYEAPVMPNLAPTRDKPSHQRHNLDGLDT